MKRIIVDSVLKDIRNSGSIPQKRHEMIENASCSDIPSVYPANALADMLHPKNFGLTVTNCYEENDTIIATLEPDDKDMTFYFREGQLLSVKFSSDESKNSFSVPVMSVSGKKQIVVYVTKLFPAYKYFRNSEGKKLTGISFEGTFFYNKLRDGDRICVLTDINGVASVYSIAVSSKNLSAFNVYIFGEEIHSFRNLNIEPVAELPDLSQYGPMSIYICGSDKFCNKMQNDVLHSGFTPVSLRILNLGADEESVQLQIIHKCKVIFRGNEYHIECPEGEKLLIALENADIPVNGRCANGECGYCRSRLIDGKVRQLAHMADKRTAADIIYGYIHPCCVTPESDITIEI